MKKINPIKLNEEQFSSLEGTECNGSAPRRLPPSGSGSGSGGGDDDGQDPDIRPNATMQGSGYSHAEITFQDGNCIWDVRGETEWEASASEIFKNGEWEIVSDSQTVTLLNIRFMFSGKANYLSPTHRFLTNNSSTINVNRYVCHEHGAHEHSLENNYEGEVLSIYYAEQVYDPDKMIWINVSEGHLNIRPSLHLKLILGIANNYIYVDSFSILATRLM